MNFYPRYPGDYMSKTMHLSMVEDGAYTRLLDWYYANEQPIPGERRYACARASNAIEKKAVDAVLAEFFTAAEGVHKSARADAEIEAARKRIDSARDNGKKGGRKRSFGDEYLAEAGVIYAIRVSPETVKVGCSKNFKSRLNQHRSKYGHQISVIHTVEVSNMGDAEWTLLVAYQDVRSCEELPIAVGDEATLISQMDAIAKQFASRSHTGSHTQHRSSLSPQRAKDSEANASGGEPPDAAEVIWGLGVPLLVSTGLAEKAARSMLGLFRKSHADAVVVEALRACAEHRPLDPIAWLQGRLRVSVKNGETTHQRTRREQVARWGGGAVTSKTTGSNVIDMEAFDAPIPRLG